jgi:hypothetical protein
VIANRYLIAGALLIALGGTAQADILTAGPAYGGTGQLGGRVFCQLFNTGTTGVVVSARQIYVDGRLLTLVGDSCGRLAPGQSCDYHVNASGGAYSCRAVVDGEMPMVTGTMEIFTKASDEHLLVMVPMTR